ncbi:ABC transporter transmembrane domain-containing protein [Ornithinimicrobium sp. W1665]|uniref:ABC transporter transmembrane domain-containing protein n=1 Tax=Ornithinimicrobium sp. W1665 TaxID=3416666 RepID=UPI003D6BCF41
MALTRATDGVSALEPYVARYLPALVTAAVVPVLAVVVLAVVDVWSALIVVLTLPLLPVFAALVGQHTQEQTERRWGAMAQLAGHFLDVVRGLPTLVAYSRARHQVAVVREVGERHRAATTATLRTAFLSTAALELLATISVALVAVAVGRLAGYGAMDLSVGLVAILLAPEAYWPVRRVGAEFHNAADGSTALAELAADGGCWTSTPHRPRTGGRSTLHRPRTGGRPTRSRRAPGARRSRARPSAWGCTRCPTPTGAAAARWWMWTCPPRSHPA